MLDAAIKGGRIASSSGSRVADIGVRGGKIERIGDLSSVSAALEINAEGLLVLPGVIDTHVHFREPGLTHKEDLESGTRAAILGGVTTTFEMPNTDPLTTTREALDDKIRRAQGRAWCDHAFFVGASKENAERLGELEMLDGTPGVKVFMGSSTGSLLIEHDDLLRKVLQSGTRPCAVHAEDEARLRARKAAWQAGELELAPGVLAHSELRDATAAYLATERLLALSVETGRPVHILHVSTRDELPLIREAKQRGLPTTAEITPQHLWFSAPEAYEEHGSKVQINPPIRSNKHRHALRQALEDGEFDVFGSDHAPHTLEEKAKRYPDSPSGLPGVQTLLPCVMRFVHEGLISLGQAIHMLCERPCELYGISGKGRIEVGYDADLVIVKHGEPFEAQADWLQSKCGWSPFEGETLFDRPRHVFLRGSLVVSDGKPAGSPLGQPARFDWKPNA